MKISPIKNRSKVITVNEAIGRMLVSKGKFVVADSPEKKAIEPEPVVEVAQVEPEVRISPLTGKPVRQYRNRSMESE